jgi:predicted nucleotidyltransferase
MDSAMPNKDDIITILKQLKPRYEREGFILLGLFGSYAKETQTPYSDIDIAYTIDYQTFSQTYKDGFSKILRIEDIKHELQEELHAPVDLVPNSNPNIIEEMINV